MVSFAAPTAAMPPPPTPIIKRPTLGTKRNSSLLDIDDEANLSSTYKRQKVSFNDYIDVKVMPDWNDESYDLVKEKVRCAIQRHLAPAHERDDTQYAKILHLLGPDAFSTDAPSSKLLQKYMVALNSHMPALGECGKLVMAILDVSWLGREEGLVAVYTNFLVILASTHGKYTSAVMDRLVAHFERLPASTGRLPGEEPVTRTVMFDRVHSAVQLVTSEVPAAGIVLLRMLKHQFPNDMSTAKGQIQYQRHLLRVAEEVPHLKSEIIALIVQRLVDVDVQIQQDLDDLEDDEEEEKLLQRQPSKEADAEDSDDDSDLESVSESEMTTTEEEQRLRDLRLKVAKMDTTQDLLFEYYEPAFKNGQHPRDNEAYQELLSHFTTFIMPNRSRHAQFLLFHFSQVSSVYANDFLQHCLSLTLDRTAATPTRLTACAYVASFAARASQVPAQSVRTVFVLLCNSLDSMRRQYEPNCMGPDRKSYGMYYAVAQALLYIFCFKWRDLVVDSCSTDDDENMSEEDVLAEGNDLKWIYEIKEILSTNVQSPLNPLKVCSAAIVTEFAKISNHLRFLYVFSLLERNKRIRLGQAPSMFRFGGVVDIGRRETAWDRKTGDAHHQLEAYFPFDPYHLPQSKRWLEGEYNEWKLPRGMKREENDDESESEDEYESDDESIFGDLSAQTTGDVDDHISISS